VSVVGCGGLTPAGMGLADVVALCMLGVRHACRWACVLAELRSSHACLPRICCMTAPSC
jgi:hypothetical protein